MKTTPTVRAAVVAITLLGFALRAYHLAGQSLWYDEGFSVYLAQKSLAEISARTAADIQPPLYYYLLHIWMLISGHSEFAVRFASVVCSVLTVPLVYLFARRLLTPALGVLAALLMAFSPFHVWYAQEARMYALVTMLGVLSCWLLLRALADVERRQRTSPLLWLLLVLVNIAAVYSHYYAFFLVAFQVVFLALCWLWHSRPRPSLWGGLVAEAATVLAYLPWAGFALNRYAADESYWQGALSLDFVRKTFLAFAAGHTLFESQAQAVAAGYLALALIGAGALWAMRRPRSPQASNGSVQAASAYLSGRQACVFLLLYVVIPFVLLYVLSALRPKFNPRYLMLASPPFFVLVAAGISGLWLLRRPVLRLLAVAGLVFVLATSAWALTNMYSNRVYVRDDVRSVAAYIQQQRQPGEAVVLVSGHMFPVAAYYGIDDDAVFRLPDIETLSTRSVLTYDVAGRLNEIAAGRSGLWLVLWQDEVVDPNGIVSGLLDSQAERLAVDKSFWGMELRHYRLSPGTTFTAPQIANPLRVNFGNSLTLAGCNLGSDAAVSGQAISLTLFWQAQKALDADYWQTLRLVDPAGHVFGQADQRPASYLYPTTRWQPGVTIPGPASLTILPGTPPGDYAVRLGVYAPASGQSLDILDANGAPSGQSAVVGTVHVVQPAVLASVDSLGLERVLNLAMGGGMQLVGTTLADRQVRQGETLHFSVFWRNAQAVSQDYRLRLTQVALDGTVLDERIVSLAGTAYPTSTWPAGSLVRGQYDLTVGANAAGQVAVQAALLNASGALFAPAQTLARLTLTQVAHVTEAPAMEHQQRATFGNIATLIGYDLGPSSVRPGQTIDVTLYWRAGPGAQDAPAYTVFTHLLGADGRIYGQDDSQPAEGTRPSTGWMAGEIISDRHRLTVRTDAPVGSYTIEIGLYEPLSGQRVLALASDGSASDHVIVSVAAQVQK